MEVFLDKRVYITDEVGYTFLCTSFTQHSEQSKWEGDVIFVLLLVHVNNVAKLLLSTSPPSAVFPCLFSLFTAPFIYSCDAKASRV